MVDSVRSEGPLRFDYNHDAVMNHDDIQHYILNMGADKSVNDLLEFQKAGGQLNAQDLVDFMSQGGTVSGSDVEKFASLGGKLNQADLEALRNAGLQFTPSELVDLAKSSIKVTAQDLLALKGPDGKALATGDDMVKLKELGTEVKPEDLIALQSAGGTITSQQVISLANLGVTFTVKDLSTLAKGGTTFKVEELTALTKKMGLNLTSEELKAINTVPDTTEKPDSAGDLPKDPFALIEKANAGLPVTVQDLLALKGPDGKPLADVSQLAALQAAGVPVTADDLLAFQAAGGTFNGGGLQHLVEGGMKITPSQIASLSKGGMQITDVELKAIIKSSGLKLTSEEFKAIDPISYTTGKHASEGGLPKDPIAMIDMVNSGLPVTVQDLLALKSPDGKPLADVSQLAALQAAGIPVTADDLLAFQAAGGTFNGGALQHLVEIGVPITPSEIATLSKGGMQITDVELAAITKKLDLNLTSDELKAINPISYTTGKPVV